MVYRASNGYHFRHVSSHNYLILHVKMRKKSPAKYALGLTHACSREGTVWSLSNWRFAC